MKKGEVQTTGPSEKGLHKTGKDDVLSSGKKAQIEEKRRLLK